MSLKDRDVLPYIILAVITIGFLLGLMIYPFTKWNPHTVTYNLEEGVYYHFEAENNQDGWIKYFRNESDAVYVYGYYNEYQIIDEIERYTILKENGSIVNWFGWLMTWKGDKLFEFTNDFGEIKIDRIRYSYIGEDPNYEVPTPIYAVSKNLT